MLKHRHFSALLALTLLVFLNLKADAEEQPSGLSVQNGWYVHDCAAVWGYMSRQSPSVEADPSLNI